MAKVFKITPKEEKQVNGVGILPSMEIYVIAHSDAPDPFHDGGVEVREGFMKWHGVDIQNCDAGDFEVEALDIIKIDSFYRGRAKIEIETCPPRKKKKCGVIDNSGKFITPPIYDNISVSNNYDCIKVNMGYKARERVQIYAGKWGVVDLNHHSLIPLKYRSIIAIGRNNFVAQNNRKKLGIIDIHNKTVVPFKYNGFGYKSKEPTFGTIDERKYWFDRCLPSTLACLDEDHELIPIEYKDKWGVLNIDNKTIIPFEYDTIGHLDENGYLRVKKERKWGCISLKGEILISFIYSYIGKTNCSKEFIIVRYEDKWGLINTRGETIVPCEYDFIHFDGRHIAVNKDGKCGCISEKGEVLIPIIYDDLRCKQDSELMSVKYKGKWGVIDDEKNVIVPCKYDEAYVQDYGFTVSQMGKWGAINKQAETIIPFDEYDFIGYIDKYDRILAKKDKKYGCFSKKGEILIPFIYDDMIYVWDSELIPVKWEGECFYIDRKGERVFL